MIYLKTSLLGNKPDEASSVFPSFRFSPSFSSSWLLGSISSVVA